MALKIYTMWEEEFTKFVFRSFLFRIYLYLKLHYLKYMCTSKSKLLMEVVRDEVAVFVSNSIRMSLICNFIFCCNGQSVSFFTY